MRKISWRHLPPPVKKMVDCVSRAGALEGVLVYMVGGTVRDILLKKRNVDLDCVVEGDAVALAKRVASLVRGEVKIHGRFRTATVTDPDHVSVDFAMAREENYPYPGSLPVVKPGTIAADLNRRDFTINAMAIALHGPDAGVLLDRHGGVRDLNRGFIRILHDNSFIDDPTRILRGVRFEQRLNFRFAPETAGVLKAALRHRVLARITPARYFTDFRKVLKEDAALMCVRRLRRLGALDPFFKACPANERTLALIEKRRLKLPSYELGQGLDWALIRFMAVVDGVPLSEIENFFQGVPLSRRERTLFVDSAGARTVVRLLSVKNMASSNIYDILKPLALENILFIRLWTSAKIVQRRVDVFLKMLRGVTLDISGNDVKKALGKRPSRLVGRVLEEALAQKLDGRCPDRDSQLEWIRGRAGTIEYVKGGC